MITIHADPDEAEKEISALPDVIMDAQNNFAGEDDFIVLGDLNADCSYFDEEDTTNPLRSNQYTWIIDNTQDTNVASSECTYDRIIITDGAINDYTGRSGIYRYDTELGLTTEETEDVSDHFPVWIEFYSDSNTNNAPPQITGYTITGDIAVNSPVTVSVMLRGVGFITNFTMPQNMGH